METISSSKRASFSPSGNTELARSSSPAFVSHRDATLSSCDCSTMSLTSVGNVTGISTGTIKFSENEVIRAAMELHDPTIPVISLRGKDYDVHVRSGSLRCVCSPEIDDFRSKKPFLRILS